MNNLRILLVPALAFALGSPALLAAQNRVVEPAPPARLENGSVPVYRVTVVGRTIRAINYRYRRGDTKLDLVGTALMPRAEGSVTARSNQGFTKLDVDFKHIGSASQFGPEFLTYVLWAITPNGRPANLGEVVPNEGGKTDLHVTSELQAFGLIVTAEPYWAVTQPSDVVVMENRLRHDTEGVMQDVDAKYELLKRGAYTANLPPSEVTPIPVHGDLLQVAEAHNAERIARWFGADRDAADTFRKAEQDLVNADGYAPRDHKSAAMMARQATQTFEDARLVAVERQEQAALERERRDREQAQARAETEAAQAAEARARAEQQRLEATERAREEAQRAREAEQARQRAEAAQQQAQVEAERARQQMAQAQQMTQQAEQDRAQAREQLREQLNQILATRESARGLIMTMSDVLFDTGQWTLKPGARERLAKVAGIMIAHPDLKLQVEGHTDSVGGEDYNQQLSEKRAASVRDYLVTQGVRPENITAEGFGKTMPVASNDTAAGRQQNRRVEIVVSGESLGQPAGGVESRR